jgi:hypothetical protein
VGAGLLRKVVRGLGYLHAARNAGLNTRNVALFTDRCASALTLTSLGLLEDLEEIVLAAIPTGTG